MKLWPVHSINFVQNAVHLQHIIDETMPCHA